MIDTHCHSLPGLDDGPATITEAIQLARMMLADGVSGALCTPHYSRQFQTRHADALAQHEVLRGELAAEGIALETAVAAEVSPAYAVSAPLEELELRSVGGRFVVVEVLLDSPEAVFPTVAERLGARGLVPVFAHPSARALFTASLRRSTAPGATALSSRFSRRACSVAGDRRSPPRR